jgi:D-3-phosphoglycerate dehydrogenase
MAMRKKTFEVVITDSEFPNIDLEQRILGRVGAKIRKFQLYDPAEVKEVVRTADGILVDYAQITREVISNLDRARAIVLYGTGLDNVDLKAATEKEILVCNVPDFMTYEVAHHSVALTLALVRRIPWADDFVKSGGWAKEGRLASSKMMPLGYIDGNVAGIIGLGRIGRQVAEIMKTLRADVIAFDPYVPHKEASKLGIEMVGLQTLMKRSDFISINAALTDRTHHLVGEKEIRLMKPTAMIVNTSRGKIIDQKALSKALRSRAIAGAGLDVLEEEPPGSDDQLLKLDNVILSPHIGGASEKSLYNLRKLAAEELARILRGEPPKHLANPKALKK